MQPLKNLLQCAMDSGFRLWSCAFHLAEIFSCCKTSGIDVQLIYCWSFEHSTSWTCSWTSCHYWSSLVFQFSTPVTHWCREMQSSCKSLCLRNARLLLYVIPMPLVLHGASCLRDSVWPTQHKNGEGRNSNALLLCQTSELGHWIWNFCLPSTKITHQWSRSVTPFLSLYRVWFHLGMLLLWSEIWPWPQCWESFWRYLVVLWLSTLCLWLSSSAFFLRRTYLEFCGCPVKLPHRVFS